MSSVNKKGLYVALGFGALVTGAIFYHYMSNKS